MTELDWDEIGDWDDGRRFSGERGYWIPACAGMTMMAGMTMVDPCLPGDDKLCWLEGV